MGNTNAIALIRGARETTIKNRQAAIDKVAASFDKEIASYDAALRHLSGTAPKPRARVAKKAKPAKKAAPVKKAPLKKATPKKTTAKKAAPAKKAPVKKKVAAKKAIPKKTAPVSTTGGYPSKGTILEKMSFVLKQEGRFMSIAQVADQVKKREPSESTDKLKRRFSKHINKFKAAGRIVSYAVEATHKMYYGLPEFLEGGKVRKGAEHKEK